MRPVTHDYQSLNEYTFPLQGKPYYRSSGIIYAVDRSGNKYAAVSYTHLTLPTNSRV